MVEVVLAGETMEEAAVAAVLSLPVVARPIWLLMVEVAVAAAAVEVPAVAVAVAAAGVAVVAVEAKFWSLEEVLTTILLRLSTNRLCLPEL
jgi:hypothetical protein